MALGILFQTQDFISKWASEGRDPVDARSNDIDDWAYEKKFSCQSLRDAVSILHENGFVLVTAPGSQEEFDQRMKKAAQRAQSKISSDLFMNEMLSQPVYRKAVVESREAVKKRVNSDPLIARMRQGIAERQEVEKKRQEEAKKVVDRYKDDEDEPKPQPGAGGRILVRRKNQKNPKNEK